MKNSLLRVITKKYARLMISMVLVSSLGCGIMSGMTSGFLSLNRTFDEYVEDMKYPDVVIVTDITTKDMADRLRDLDGVEEVNARLEGNLVLIDKEGRYVSVDAMTYEEDEFQKFYYWEKSDKRGDYPILLEHSFSEKRDIHAGDVVEVHLGEDVRSCTVYGIVSRPEVLVTPSIGQMKIGYSDCCYMYVPASLLKDEENPEYVKALAEWEEKNREYTEAKEQADSEHEKAEAKIREAETELAGKETELTEGITEAERQKRALESNRTELKKKLNEISSLSKELEEKKRELQEGEEKYREESTKLDAAKDEVEAGWKELNGQKKELDEQYQELKEGIAEGEKQLAEAKKTLKEWESFTDRFSRYKSEIEELTEDIKLPKDAYQEGRELAARMDEILSDTDYVIWMLKQTDEWLESDTVNSIIDRMGKYAASVRSMRDDLVKAVENREDPEVIEGIRQKFVSTSELFLENCVKNKKTMAEVVKAVFASVQNMKDQIEAGELQLQKSKDLEEDVENGLKLVEEGREKLITAGSEIEEGEKKLQEGAAELEAAAAKIKEGEQQIVTGRKQVEQYLVQIENGINAIEEGIRQGRKEYADAVDLVADARKELEDQWDKVQKELSAGEEELGKAKEELDSWEGYDVFCNQFMIRVSAGADPETVRQQAVKALDGLEIKDSFTYQDSMLRRRVVNENLDPLGVMSVFVPLIFFAVALIVVFLFMNLLVRRCRREIGILRALGYTRGSIVLQFCTVSLVISLLASLIGLLIGLAVAKYTGGYFQDFFDLYYLKFILDWKKILLAVGITILVGQVSTLLSMGYVNRVAPVEAMTRPAPKTAFHMGGFMKNGNSFFKYCVFTLMRNKARFFFSVICLASSVMLIFLALSFGESKDRILVSYYEERIQYDCEVYFSYEPSSEKIQKLVEQGYAKDPEIDRYYMKEIRFNGASEQATIQAIPMGTDKIKIFDTSQKEIFLQEEGIILEKHLTDSLGIKVGDEVTIDGVPVRVTHISEQYEGRKQYISSAYADQLWSPSVYSVLLNVDSDQEIALVREISKIGGYVFASFTDRNYEYWQDGFKGFTACEIIIIIFSIMIGLIIIINTLHANLLEQKRDLCIMRTLGFQRSELSFRLLFQSGMYYIFAILPGIPLGVWGTQMTLDKMETAGRSYPFVNTPSMYLLTCGMVLAYLLIGHAISMRDMKRWDIVESVKDKE